MNTKKKNIYKLINNTVTSTYDKRVKKYFTRPGLRGDNFLH